MAEQQPKQESDLETPQQGASMFTVCGQLMNFYSKAEQISKATGEVIPGSYHIQVMGDVPVSGSGSRFQLQDLKVPSLKPYVAFKGKKIRVPIGFMKGDRDVILFVPKGSLPELIA